MIWKNIIGRLRKWNGLLLPVVVIAPATLAAAEPNPQRLTGDWGGLRSELGRRGVSFDLDSTHFHQGLLSGTGEEGFEYGGRLDGFLTLIGDGTLLWKGGMLLMHAEYSYGEVSPALARTLFPTNTGVLLPDAAHPEDLVVTNIALAQKVSDAVSFIIGKINTVDLIAADPFGGGGGRDRFFNLAFAAPPNGLVPPVIMGAVVSFKSAPLEWTFMLYDPKDRTRDYWPSGLFDSGVSFSVGAKRSGLVLERTSSIAVSGIYSTADSIDLSDVLLPPALHTGLKRHSWHASVQLAHFLRESAAHAGDGWGVFMNLGVSDGNPNPFQAWTTFGIGGRGLLPSRPADSFGVGYFYHDLSDDLQNALDPLATLRDEQGIEAYYDFAVASWLRMAFDLQYVKPATAVSDNALIGGLRLKVRF